MVMIVEAVNLARDRATGESFMAVILSSTAVDIITVETVEKLTTYSDEDINLILEHIISKLETMNIEDQKIFNHLLTELKRFVAGQ